MRHKRLKNILVSATAMALLTSSIPLNLTVFAGSVGGGLVTPGGGSASHVDDDSINDDDLGLRFTLVTLENGERKVVQNTFGTYYYDLWGYSSWYTPDYNYINYTSRYDKEARIENITYDYTSSFDVAINNWVATTLNGTSNISFSSMLAPNNSSSKVYYEDGHGLYLNGAGFRNWFTQAGGIVDGKEQSVYSLFMQFLYGGKLQGLDMENTFLIVEPILSLCNPDGNMKTTGSRYIASWYGYINYNVSVGRDPGSAITVRTRLAQVGNGFEFADANDATQDEINKLQSVLGLQIPKVGLPTSISNFKFPDKNYDVYGYGIQAYWLKDMTIPDPKDPIDTYDIDKDPTNPDKPEEPKKTPDPSDPDNPDKTTYDSTGEKTIIKTYVDLYTDADNNSYYTKAIDQGTYIEHNTSNQVVITDESDQNGGYEVVAWYTSQTDTTDTDTYNPDSLHGTDMLQTTDHTDSTHQSIGKEQFTLDGYTSITGISDTGSKSYTYVDNHTPNSLSTKDNSPRYTKEDNIQEPIEKDDKDQYNTDEYIDLGTDNTIVLLYIREHDWINTETFTGGGHGTGTGSSGGGNGSGTGTGSGGTPEQGELKIVKAYGIVNPDTYEITNDKDTATIENVTRNVHITPESGYRLAEYVYSTRGNEDDVVWNNMTAESWGTLTNTEQDDTVFYMKGFIDGFSEPYGSALYSSKYAWTDTEQPVGSLSSTYTSDLTYPGTYGTGRLSGNTLTNYNSTIYFDMADPDNTDTTDDVLYILFLKEDEVEYKADNFVIPESFITRHNDFATNNITVTGNLTGETSSYLFAKHKFKYSLPLVTGFSESNGDSITAWTDPYIIASISQTNTATTNGLISKWSKTELITYNTANDTIDKRTSTDNSYELAVQKEQTTPSILSFTNANYSYTAYRKDDKPTLAQWKLEQLNSLSADSTYSMDTTGASLPLWIQGAEAFETIDSWNTDICNYSNELVGNRQSNDTTSNFSLPLHFTDTKATGDGVDLQNIPLIDTDTTVNGNNIIRKATATISGTSTDIQLKSEYISLFDVDVTQQVDYQIHYGSSKGSSYADDTKNVTNGTGTGTQSGGVQVMKKDNTIVDKYGQKHTIFISRKKKNMLHKRKR
ncbi:MAG: hypothetical protein K2L10_07290 [Ruminococcus sp.]|nr:hypothetical protein [Ruminococcus sp.]